MGNKVIRYESGQTAYPFEEMTDAGDLTTFSASFSPISLADGFTPVFAPYGVKTGGIITPTATDNEVSVAALTASMAGATGADANGDVSVASGTLTVSRATATDTHCITSITVDSTGTLVAIGGLDGTSFSETRGAAGGPPFIPVGSVEVGQTRLSSNTDAAVGSAEILQVIGLHQERSNSPAFSKDYENGKITFNAALPAIHTGGVAKKVYVKGATPIFAEVPKGSDWSPADTSYSPNSVETYDGAINSTTASLGSASFTAIVEDGVSDDLVQLKGQNLWFEYRPDRDVTVPNQKTLGRLGITREFPASGSITLSCTIVSEQETSDNIS